jgi:hypothetical protein
MFEEAIITINGITLSSSQAMVVRIAVTDFHMEMSEPNAVWVTKAYSDRAAEILKIILK